MVLFGVVWGSCEVLVVNVYMVIDKWGLFMVMFGMDYFIERNLLIVKRSFLELGKDLCLVFVVFWEVEMDLIFYRIYCNMDKWVGFFIKYIDVEECRKCD